MKIPSNIKRVFFKVILNDSNMVSYSFSAFLTLVVILITMFMFKITPFGDNTFALFDADQYVGFYSYFQNALQNNNNFFYSWGMAPSGNAISLLGYYCSSPFNFIFLLFKDNFYLGLTFITILKLILISISFCVFLSYFIERKHFTKAIFSICYTYCGYIVSYIWNTSWFDAVMMLPLMTLGIVHIIDNKKPYLYILSITFTLISNFYTGYMLLIISPIFFISYYFITLTKKTKKHLFKKSILYILSTILSIGMSCVFLIPIYNALPSYRKNPISKLFINEINKTTFNFSDLFIQFFTGIIHPDNGFYHNNYPLIFIGLTPLTLLFCFFFSKEFKLKYKILSLIIMSILVFSFYNSFINYMWHGTTKNLWWNYRYSFIFSFVCIILSFLAFIKKNSTPNLIGVFFITIFCEHVFVNAKSSINLKYLSLDFLFMYLTIITLIFFKRYKIHIITILIISNILINNYRIINIGIYSTRSIENYKFVKNNLEHFFSEINDKSFFRFEKTIKHCRSDPMMFNYAGITNFSSVEKKEMFNTIKALGYTSKINETGFSAHAPLSSNALLGIKYILSDKSINKDLKKIYNQYGFYSYKNEYAIPIIFLGNKENLIAKGKNDFENINLFFKNVSFKNNNKNIFDTIDYTEDKKYNKLKLNYVIDLTLNKISQTYIMFPTNQYHVYKMKNSEGDIFQIPFEHTKIQYLGKLTPGVYRILITKNDERAIDKNSIIIAVENENVLKEYTEEINKNYSVLNKITSSHFQGAFNSSKNNAVLETTIPYDEGWRIKIDDKKVKYLKNMYGFLCIPNIKKGYHKIELNFIPKGFYLGLIVTINSFLIFLYMIYKDMTKKNKI